MKTWLRILLYSLTLCAVGTGVVLSLKAERGHRSEFSCSALEVEFRDSLRFVSEEDIKTYLKNGYGAYVGEQIDSIGLDRIEKVLDGRSAISKSEAWVTPDGILHISIAQREPVLRFDDKGKGHYIDRNLEPIALHPRYVAPVPVMEGPIQSDTLWLRGAVELAGLLIHKGMWPSRYEKILCDSKGIVSLMSSEGGECFILGRPEDLEAKFSKIDLYNEKIKPAGKGYKRIDLRFGSQIICRQ